MPLILERSLDRGIPLQKIHIALLTQADVLTPSSEIGPAPLLVYQHGVFSHILEVPVNEEEDACLPLGWHLLYGAVWRTNAIEDWKEIVFRDCNSLRYIDIIFGGSVMEVRLSCNLVFQGLDSLSGKTSYRQISWSLEAARLSV